MMQDATHEEIRYNWIKRLQAVDPGSDLLQKEAAKFEDLHPDLSVEIERHPSLMVRGTKEESGPPRNTYQLLGKPPSDWVPILNNLTWERDPALTPPDPVIESAATKDPGYVITLAQAMMSPQPMDTPAWPSIISGLCQAQLTREQQSSVLGIMGNPTIQARNGHSIAEHLYGIVKHGGKPYAIEVLDQAETLASSLWNGLQCDIAPAANQSWFHHSTSFYGVGYLPLFWANSAAIRMRHQDQGNLTDACRLSLGAMLNDSTIKGRLAHSAIGTQTAFLLKADQEWTAGNLIPVFASNEDPRCSVTWEGFVRSQHVDDITSQYLGGLMHRNLSAIAEALPTAEDRRFLARCYSTVLCYYAPDPGSWLKDTVDSNLPMAALTQMEIHNRLRQTDAVQQTDWWARWIRDYWRDRQQGTPGPFSADEAVVMWGWASEMPAVYPQVAEMAAGIPLGHVDWIQMEQLLEKFSQLPPAREYPWQTAGLLPVLLAGVEPAQFPTARRIVEPLVNAILDESKYTTDDKAKQELVYRIIHWMQQPSLHQE